MKSQVESLEGKVAVASTTSMNTGRGVPILPCNVSSNHAQCFEILADSNASFLPSDFDTVPKQFRSQALAVMEQKMLRLSNEQAEHELLLLQEHSSKETKRMARLYYASILVFMLGMYYTLIDPITIVWTHQEGRRDS